MEISDQIHAKAVAVETAALRDPKNSTEHPASYWLALACALLTSPLKVEREQGKELVRRWRRAGHDIK